MNKDTRAITFACYGTLVDRDAGIRSYLEPLLRTAPVAVEAWLARWKTIYPRMLRPYRPYGELLARSYDATMQHFALEAFVDAGPALARSVAAWLPFADAAPALRRLARRFRVGIVSNGDHEQLAATLGHLQAPISIVLSSAEAQAHKPDPRLFQLALDRFALEPHQVLHVATSEPLDLAPARALGMQTAQLDRERSSLAALADSILEEVFPKS